MGVWGFISLGEYGSGAVIVVGLGVTGWVVNGRVVAGDANSMLGDANVNLRR